jgi:hypothetical protein
MGLVEIHVGAMYAAHLLLDDRGLSQVQELITDPRTPERDRGSFRLRVQRLCDIGPQDMASCDYVEDGVWKLTVSHHLRVYLFRDGTKPVLTNAEWKTKRRDDPQSLVRAKVRRRTYIESADQPERDDQRG